LLVGLPLSSGAYALEQKALALKAAGRFDEAIAAFLQLTRLTPQSHGAYYNLGNSCLAANRLQDAADAYRRAIRLAPRFAPAHNNLGLALLSLKQPALAAAPLARAALLDPANAGSQHMAGHALLVSGKAAEALPYLREAYRLAPRAPAVATDLADALRRTGRLLDVAPLAREAASLAPDCVEAWNNLANAERDAGDFAAATHASRRALALNPDDADAHCNLALTLLAAGDLRAAWPHWEYRWHGLAGGRPPFSDPPWDGRDLGSQTLYLHAEQGMGDTIQFCRYATLAARRARVVLAVQRPLLRLMQSLSPSLTIIADGDPIPDFAAQAPLMSLPRAFGTETATIPADIPYLAADPARAAFWADRLAMLPGRRIGLVWAGNPDFPFDTARSIPAGLLNALSGVANVSFVSLQMGAAQRPAVPLVDWTAELTDFAETAALIAGLDLVIGVDTAVVHLAGALGRPVWLWNRFAGDWRWGAAGETTPWYPTLRQFRQVSPGDWAVPIASVVNSLQHPNE
jgi:tetratricopeptide (TPR) repeat protein